MTLNSYFDGIFIINLLRRRDRWEECLRELDRQGIHESDVTRVEASDCPEDGNKGCTKSHRDLIRRISNSSWKRVLVLEDDFETVTLDVLKANGFIPEYDVWKTHCSVLNGGGTLEQRFSYLSNFLPDKWDVLYLGAGYGERPISRYNRHVIRCGFMQTTSSYGITREFAKRWTEQVDKHTLPEHHPGPIDNVFGSMSHENLFYVLQPRLIFQRQSLSDLTGGSNSNFCSMTDPVHEMMV